MSFYKLEHGSYYLYTSPDSRVPKYMTDAVSICFDTESFALLKHGSYKDVFSWWDESRRKSPDLFRSVQVMTLPRGFSVTEVNKALDTAGYIQVLLEKIGVATPEFGKAGI